MVRQVSIVTNPLGTKPVPDDAPSQPRVGMDPNIPALIRRLPHNLGHVRGEIPTETHQRFW